MATDASHSATHASDPSAAGSKPQSKRPDLKNTIWIPNGNLIIKVKGQQKTYLHRVDSSLLVVHSKIFANMVEFSSGQAQKATEECPEVELHDPPKDVHSLLEIIFLRWSPPVNKTRKAVFETLAPIFTIAEKYEMAAVIERLLPTLEEDWPTTLDAWDRNETEIKRFQASMEIKCFEDSDTDRVDDVFPEPCRVIAVARQCGLDSVLPSAFYHLSRIDPVYHPDPDPDFWDFFQDGGRTADSDYLETRDWKTLARGTGFIRQWCGDLLQIFRPAPISQSSVNLHGPTSPQYRTCSDRLGAMGKDFEAKLFERKEVGWGIDPLAVMEEYQQQDHQELCYQCARRLRVTLVRKRVEFWHKLPEFFGLKDWPNADLCPSEDE